MTTMRTWSLMAAAAGCLLMACACATKIAGIGITERDHQLFTEAEAVPYRIAVACRDADGDAQEQKLAESIRNGMLAELAKSRNVEPVFTPEPPGGRRLFPMPPRKPDLQALGATHALTFSVRQTAMRSLGTATDDDARYQATLTLDIALARVPEGQAPLFSRRIAVTSTSTTQKDSLKEAMPTLLEASDAAAVQAVRDLLAEAIPAAVVRQTKGGGQVALLNIGSDDGIRKGTKIEFFFYRDKGGERLAVPFATGKVAEAEEKACWVKVDDHQAAGVMENHFARPGKDQSMSFFEKVEGKLGM
jgi:hypothetical protein